MIDFLNKYILLFIISLICFSNAGAQTKTDSLSNNNSNTLNEFRDQLDYIFNDPVFSNAHWGAFIMSLETGEFLYKRNEDKLFVPASGVKLFTTSAALNLLGPDYRYITSVYMKGKINNNVLIGDLIIKGTGDPTISGRFYNNNMFQVFESWADSLLALGIDEIDGNIIGDDYAFDNKGLGSRWPWDLESYWYSAPTSAISFNDNCIDLSVTVDKKEKTPVVRMNPNTKYAVVLNNVSVVPQDSVTSIDVNRESGSNVINVFGSIKAGDSVKTYVTVNNPTQYSMVVLKETLERKGITVNGNAYDIDDISLNYDTKKINKLFTHFSVPLIEIIRVINKTSQNFYAEQVFKTIGLEIKKFGSFEKGLEASGKFFSEMGIKLDGFVMADGSGLSRLNMVTPKQVVQLLHYMNNNKYSKLFLNSLPVAGVDGNLAKRLNNTSAENRIRAKAGYLENVRSLSGYAFTADNELIAFSIMVNNFTVPVKLAENIQDLVCLRLANFHRNKWR
jgi:D-alanyl-D-alanine carboxypeptidase/D-alanyl-D-alanine-endopeptidase (penicillin-binding protein 4)